MSPNHPFRFAVFRPADQAPSVKHPNPIFIAVAHPNFCLVVFCVSGKMLFQRLLRAGKIIRVAKLLPGRDAYWRQLFESISHDSGPTFVEPSLTGLNIPLPGAHTGTPDNICQTLAA